MLRRRTNSNMLRKRWRAIPLGAGLALLLTLFLAFCPLGTRSDQASAEGTTTFTASLLPSLTISMSDAISKSINPTVDGAFESLATVARVQISNCNEYNLSIKGNPNMSGTGANTETIKPVANGTTKATFTNNTWGYNLTQNAAGVTTAVAATDSTAYNAMPEASTQLVHKPNLTDNNADDYYTLNFGAKVDTTLPADTYTSTVTLSVVASPIVATTYTLTYNGNGNTGGTAPEAQTGNSLDGSYEFTIAGAGTLTRDGYRFLGWSESNTATTAQYTEGAKLTLTDPTTSKTLYAVWEQATGYSLSYNGNNNTGGSAPTAQTYDGYEDSHNFTVAGANTLTKTGYTFLGWSESNTATTAQYAANSTITLDKATPTKTLYAVWKIDGPFNGITTMQEMTSSICKSAKENDSATLKDTRDNKTYKVTKLKDGNCWMTSNMDYDIPGKKLSIGTASSSDAGNFWDDGNTTNGNYYQASAAAVACNMGGGWQLPTAGSSTTNGSFNKLTTDYGGTTEATVTAAPLNFVYAGKVSGGNINSAGEYGYYWNSDASIFGGFFSFQSSSAQQTSLKPGNVYGFSVRCLVLGS